MDIDLLKSTPADDQIEMMLMMHMHQDKSPADHVINGGGPHSDSSPMMSFSGNPGHHSSPAPTTAMPQLYDSTQNPFVIPNSFGNGNGNGEQTSMAAMREMIFRIAAMQPIYIDPESVKPPKRRNVRISKDPQSVAARHRRERISERIRILQRLVPGGTKMDTASMLDEAIHYVKFLKTQVQSLERAAVNNHRPVGLTVGGSSRSGYFPVTGGRGNNDYYCYYSHGGHTTTAPAAQCVQLFSDG